MSAFKTNLVRSTLCFTALLLATATLDAAIQPKVRNQGEGLLDAGRPADAYNLLVKENKSTAQDWFLFGMAAHQSGKLDEAERAYREVLRLDPGSGRAKLELATVLTDKGELSEARRLLLDVKAAKPPQRVVQNIDRYLALLDEREKKNSPWRIRASAGILYDSNVNNGPSVDTITLFGLPFTLSRDAKKRSDFAYTLRGEIDHLARLGPRVDWQSNVTVNWTDYFKVDEYDNVYLSGSTGPVLRLNDRTIFSIPAIADLSSYVEQGNFYSASFGVAPQLRYQATPRTTLNLNGEVKWKDFLNDSSRDGLVYSVSPGIDVGACGQGSVRFVGTVGRDDSGQNIYANDNWNALAGLFCPMGPDMALSLYGSYGEANYDGREAAYTVKRRDKRISVGGTLQYAHRPSGLDGILSVSFTDNKSNLPIYAYDKVQTSVAIRKGF